MSITGDHMSYERCVDILESELGDHEPKEAYAGVHVAQAFRISIELLKRELPMQPKKDMRNPRYGMGYEYNDWICPKCESFLAYEPSKSEIPIRCPYCGQKLMT